MGAKLKNYLHLHFIIFIWGFTAVLGKLITVDALPLVWYRMLFASLLIVLFIGVKGYSVKVSGKMLFRLIAAGIIIALHWVTFFGAIKAANVSVALATMSTRTMPGKPGTVDRTSTEGGGLNGRALREGFSRTSRTGLGSWALAMGDQPQPIRRPGKDAEPSDHQEEVDHSVFRPRLA